MIHRVIGRRMRSFLFAACVVLLISGCGGGGGAAGEPIVEEPSVSGDIKEGVVVLAQSELTATDSITVLQDGGLELSVSGPRFSQLKVQDIVHVPANQSSGLPVGFTGKVVSAQTTSGKTSLKLIPANVEDVYKSLEWDIDTSVTGARVVGVITPAGGKSDFKFSQASNHQTGALIFDKDKLSGTVSYEREFTMKNGQKISLVGEIKLADVVIKSKGSFNPTKFATGWGEIGAVVSGNLSGKVGFKAGEKVQTSSLGNLLVESGAWKELIWKGSNVFSLEGLGDTDKIGRVPLGGVVLTPAITRPFKGGLTQAELQVFASSTAVVVWVYMNADGQLSFEGESGIRHAGIDFKQGREYKLVRTTYEVTRYNQATSSGVDLYAEGAVEGKYRGGISIAADVLVGGIRPLNVSVFSGAELTSKYEGKGEIQLYPNVGRVKGHLCYEAVVWAGVEPEFAFRVKGNLGGDWVPVGLNVNFAYEFKANERFGLATKELPQECVVDGQFGLAASSDSNSSGQVRVDFADMFKNAQVQDLANIWKVTATSSTGTQLTFEIPATKAGIDVISLTPGFAYDLKIEALNQTLNLVVKSADTKIVLCTATQVLENGRCVDRPPAPGDRVWTLHGGPINQDNPAFSSPEAVMSAMIKPGNDACSARLAAVDPQVYFGGVCIMSKPGPCELRGALSFPPSQYDEQVYMCTVIHDYYRVANKVLEMYMETGVGIFLYHRYR